MNERLQQELQHGRFLAASGPEKVWNWETPAGAMRWRRRVELLIQDVTPNAEILELGCGTGQLTQELTAAGAKVVAIDVSPELLEFARQRCPDPHAVFAVEDAHRLSYSTDRFDFVLGSSVLHHLDLRAALPEIYRVLRPNGRLRFAEPNMLNPQIALQKNVPAIKRRLGDAPHETAYIRWQLKGQLEQIGFRKVHIQPFDFLHPQIPTAWIPTVKRVGRLLEATPLFREIAGSLYISAAK